MEREAHDFRQVMSTRHELEPIPERNGVSTCVFDLSSISGWFSKIGLRGGGMNGKGKVTSVSQSRFGCPEDNHGKKTLIGKYVA